jgi:hypothetical protein
MNDLFDRLKFKKMAYRDFKLNDLNVKFGIHQREAKLFQNIELIQPSDWLSQTLERNQKKIRMTTEKAVSEAIIMPILSAVQENNEDELTLFSGENLLADKSVGLNGEVDFLFIRQPQAYEIYAPVINVTEAKLNKAIEKSIAQAAAQMVGARVFNQKNDNPIETIFGVVTNGDKWIFLKLEKELLLIDSDRYSSENLPELLGAFQLMADFYK